MLSSQNKKKEHDGKNNLHRVLQFSKRKTVKITFIQYFKGFKVLHKTEMQAEQVLYLSLKKDQIIFINIKYSVII